MFSDIETVFNEVESVSDLDPELLPQASLWHLRDLDEWQIDAAAREFEEVSKPPKPPPLGQIWKNYRPPKRHYERPWTVSPKPSKAERDRPVFGIAWGEIKTRARSRCIFQRIYDRLSQKGFKKLSVGTWRKQRKGRVISIRTLNALNPCDFWLEWQIGVKQPVC